MREPIMVRCEGSGCPVNHVAVPLLAGAPFGDCCQMCGEAVQVNESGMAVDHDRVDVLAMVDRGDFGA